MRRTIAYERDDEPTTVDEALARRNALIEEVQKIQAQLGNTEGSAEWRRSAIHALNAKQGELRRLKDWLRQHDDRKASEWQLLARAYHLLEYLNKRLPTTRASEIDALLDEIEKTVPGKYLEQQS